MNEPHFVLLDRRADGVMVARIYRSLDDDKPVKTIRVPKKVREEIDGFLETKNPGFVYYPYEHGPDCVYRGIHRSTLD